VAEPKTILGLTMSQIATGASIASGVIGAVGAIGQGQAANNQAEFQATVMRQQAERDRQQAAADEEDYRRNASRLMASRRASQGAMGVESGTGSPLLVSEDFAGETELQALRIRNGGQVQADRLEQSADLTRRSGRNARTSGFTRAGSLLLSGVGTAFS